MNKDKNTFRILMIEDNPGDIAIVEEFLTEQIYAPVLQKAVNAKEAIDLLHAASPSFDIILMDLSLPDSSGQELVNKMLLAAGDCPIIILTGYTDIDFSIRSIGQGILDYLLKDDLNSITLYKSILYSIQRKKTVSELRNSEKRYSDLFNLSPEAMMVFDMLTLGFLQVNQATIALYGYSEAEFLNMTLIDIKLKEDVHHSAIAIRNIKPGDPFFKETVKHITKSGQIIEMEIHSNPLLLNDRKCVSIIAIDVTQKNQQEHNVIKAIIKTQEDERYEIGGELHDNVCQILAVSQLNLGMLGESLTPKSKPYFIQTQENISLALNEIRNLSHRLAPVFFNESTLEEAFNRLIATFNVEGKYEFNLHMDQKVLQCQISLELQLNLYRILQEQLRNIFKYANASHIEVDVILHNNKIKMSVADNGVGFNLASAKKGIGLANMKRRIELFSGRFEIITSPGEGCTILVDIPLLPDDIKVKPEKILAETI